jgi:hypothetical protein
VWTGRVPEKEECEEELVWASACRKVSTRAGGSRTEERRCKGPLVGQDGPV